MKKIIAYFKLKKVKEASDIDYKSIHKIYKEILETLKVSGCKSHFYSYFFYISFQNYLASKFGFYIKSSYGSCWEIWFHNTSEKQMEQFKKEFEYLENIIKSS